MAEELTTQEQATSKPATAEDFFAMWETQQEQGGQEQQPAEEGQQEQAAQTGQAQISEVEALRQQIAALQQENAQVRQMMTSFLQSQQKPQEETPFQPTVQLDLEFAKKVLDSLPAEQREEIENLYYEEPLKAVSQLSLLVNAAYQQHLAAEARRREQEMQQRQAMLEREYYLAAKELQDLYGIDDNTLTEVANVIAEEKRELLALPPRQAMRDAFEYWKRKKGVNELQSSVAQAIKNPQVLAEALKDPQVVNTLAQVIRPEVLKTALETNAQVPVVLGNTPGGVPPAAPPQKPRSVKEAGQLFLTKLLGVS